MTVPGILTRNMAGFGGKQCPAALSNDHTADAAGALTPAGGRDEELVFSQGAEEGSPRLRPDGVLVVVVDPDRDLTRWDQF